jgi:hypothetical protein
MMKNRTITNEYYYQKNGEGFTKTETVPAIGGIKWAQRESTGEYKQSAYYDHSFYKVPFYGPCDLGRIRNALSKLYPARFNKFGGFTTVADVQQLDAEHIKVELNYHIGD